MELFSYNHTENKDLIDIISALAPVVLGLFTVLISALAIIFSYLISKHTWIEKRKDDKRQEIYQKLNEFYGPLIQLRKRSDLLYNIFVEKFKEQDKSFRTLLYLLDDKKFTGNDKILIEQVIKIGEDSINLINSKSALIDDEYLRNNLIPKFINHLIILKLSYEGNFKGEKERFGDYVYPLELVSKLTQRFEILQQELKQLS